MKLELSAEQQANQATFRAFANSEIAPYAAQFDREQKTPPDVIKKLAQEKYLGMFLPKEVGGFGADMLTFGLLNEEIGRACSSIRSLLTVHGMVSYAIFRWGSRQQKEVWLPKLASGEAIGAFALAEPNVGSDAASVETTITSQDDTYLINGQKKWITYGQIADVFLLFGQYKGQQSAFLVEKHSPGLTVEPIYGMLGTRGSMLAVLHFNDCQIPKENLVGGVGFGLMAVGTSALDMGRYSVACGCVGIGQACLDDCLTYTSQRKQFGVYLKEHQLIKQMVTNMVVNVKAARLLCYQAGYLLDAASPQAPSEIWIAKYFASTMATKVTSDAVQIHGANGCAPDAAVQRYLRDAKIMEIIEGSTQIQQIFIAENAY